MRITNEKKQHRARVEIAKSSLDELLRLKKESSVTGKLEEKDVGPASSPPIKIVLSNE